MNESEIAFVGARLIDGAGNEPIEDSALVVTGDMITQVGSRREVSFPDKIQTVNASRYTFMPGLIDAHVHFNGGRSHSFTERIIPSKGLRLLRAAQDAKDALNAGFTTMRCMAGAQALDLKKAISEGTIKGPRIKAAGYALSQTFGHGDPHYFPLEYAKQLEPTICDGVDEVIKGARYALREGGDFIKVSVSGGVMSQKDDPKATQYTLEELKAIVQEARHALTYCAAHAHGVEGIMNALVAGFKTIEHGTYADDDCRELMIKNDTILLPTFSIAQQIVDHGEKYGIVPWAITKGKVAQKEAIVNAKKAYEYGVKIAMGTDFSTAPLLKIGGNAMELHLMEKNIGMTPMEVIVATTKMAAEACAVQDITGTLEEGKQADLILVEGDPLKNLRILEDFDSIKLVMKGGVIEADRR
jgi:imidazolonepropionase-like amidohydrolase